MEPAKYDGCKAPGICPAYVYKTIAWILKIKLPRPIEKSRDVLPGVKAATRGSI